MKTANIVDFKNHLSRYLGAVEAGEIIEIRRRNIPFARVIPLQLARANRTRLGLGQGSATIAGDLTEPLIDEGDWAMLSGTAVDGRPA
ncbi:MAG: type II toxin-antitoxin system Phd/YefM family antitoxin [Acidobacteria bacterium]|nr:type II toxin-antitoxin system Phd/YefM family antitoxin [Acidobacteriota bacterium]